jgi:hypothetical protein
MDNILILAEHSREPLIVVIENKEKNDGRDTQNRRTE